MGSEKCPSCGVGWIEHLGMTGTCAELQRERRATLEAAGTMAGYIEDVRRLREALESTLEENTELIRALERIEVIQAGFEAGEIAYKALQRAGGGE